MSIELITWTPLHTWYLAEDTDPEALHELLSRCANLGRTLDITGIKGERITLNPAQLQAWTIETGRK